MKMLTYSEESKIGLAIPSTETSLNSLSLPYQQTLFCSVVTYVQVSWFDLLHLNWFCIVCMKWAWWNLGTACLYTLLDLGFSVWEGRESLVNMISKLSSSNGSPTISESYLREMSINIILLVQVRKQDTISLVKREKIFLYLSF